ARGRQSAPSPPGDRSAVRPARKINYWRLWSTIARGDLAHEISALKTRAREGHDRVGRTSSFAAESVYPPTFPQKRFGQAFTSRLRAFRGGAGGKRLAAPRG